MMNIGRCFPLFGSSCFMDTLEAYLGDAPSVHVVRIHPSVPHVASRLQSLRPDLIFVDLNAPNLGFVAAVLHEQPGVPIFCVDVTCSRMVVLTGCHYTIATVDELLAIVEHYSRLDRDVSDSPLRWPPVPEMVHSTELVDIQTEGKR